MALVRPLSNSQHSTFLSFISVSGIFPATIFLSLYNNIAHFSNWVDNKWKGMYFIPSSWRNFYDNIRNIPGLHGHPDVSLVCDLREDPKLVHYKSQWSLYGSRTLYQDSEKFK